MSATCLSGAGSFLADSLNTRNLKETTRCVPIIRLVCERVFQHSAWVGLGLALATSAILTMSSHQHLSRLMTKPTK